MDKCIHCGLVHETTCSRIKSIEYHPDGVTVKRIEFHPITPLDVDGRNLWALNGMLVGKTRP